MNRRKGKFDMTSVATMVAGAAILGYIGLKVHTAPSANSYVISDANGKAVPYQGFRTFKADDGTDVYSIILDHQPLAKRTNSPFAILNTSRVYADSIFPLNRKELGKLPRDNTNYMIVYDPSNNSAHVRPTTLFDQYQKPQNFVITSR